MEVAYSSKALEDIDYWKETGNKKNTGKNHPINRRHSIPSLYWYW